MSQTRPRITRDDLEAKFRELQSEVDVVEDEARNYALVAAVAGVVVVVAIVGSLGVCVTDVLRHPRPTPGRMAANQRPDAPFE